MMRRFLCLAVALTAVAVVMQAQIAPSRAAAANAKAVRTWTPPRAADGHPDLQGFWSNNNATPLERPKELAGRAALTDEEVAAMKKKAHELFGGNADAAFGDNVFLAVYENVKGIRTGFKSVDGETGDYSSVWTVERDWDNRTSLITDPPDGRIPPMTSEAEQRRAEMREAARRPARGPEDRSLSERCITYGSPQLTEGYQSYYQIVQTPNAVTITTEMIHDTRVIRLGGAAHPAASVHQWMGDSVGRWEGDTLVVDSTNYKPRAFMGVSSEKLHVTERFSRSGPDTLKHEITVNDPGTWTKPWSIMIPLRVSQNPVYEYACHEGNEGLRGILAGARADEAREQARK